LLRILPGLVLGFSVFASSLSAQQPPAAVLDDIVPLDTKEAAPTCPSNPPALPLVDDSQPSANPFTYRIRGRIETDAIYVHQTPRDQAILGELENAFGFRRARIGAEGTAGDQVRWVAEFDFASGSIAFRDVYVAIDKLPILGEVRVGNFWEPFSLEGQTSSNYFTFMERSPIEALDPARHWGVGVFNCTEDDRATFAFGAFRSGSGLNGTDISNQNDTAYTARVTALPWYADSGMRLMHVGAAFSQTFPPNDIVTFNQGPRNSLLQTSDDPLTTLVPDISIPATQYQLYNVQWAMVLGPLSFQAEWTGAYIEQIGGGPVFLHGSYVFFSYFLTGEHREYDTRYGTFRGINVQSPFVRMSRGQGCSWGPGAWELTARLSYLDFSDPNIPPVNGLKVGDRLTTATLGVNWYLSTHARLMFNYVHAVPVDPNFGPSGVDTFSIRCAVYW